MDFLEKASKNSEILDDLSDFISNTHPDDDEFNFIKEEEEEEEEVKVNSKVKVYEIDTLQNVPPWKQGAEACIFYSIFAGKSCIVKQRLKKRYRHPELDKQLTSQRLKAEVRMMNKCRKVGVRTPLIYFVDMLSSRIFMQLIKPSITVNDYINVLFKLVRSQQVIKTIEHKIAHLGCELAKVIYKLHANNIIHGDLTPSNILVKDFKTEDDIYLIDFGLAGSTTLVEDKAVDLFVLERSFSSQHPELEKFSFFANFYKSYGSRGKQADKILEKLEEARQRGRKMCMLG